MNGPWSDTPSAWVGDNTAWVSGDASVSVGIATIYLGPSTATASPVVAVEAGVAQGSFSTHPCTIIHSFPATGFVTLSTETIGVDTYLHSYDTYSPSSGVDDGHWFISGSFNGQLYNSSSDVVFGYRSDDKLDAFCRFDISIPRGATIISAVPIFICKQNCSGSYNLNLYFAALDDPSAPTSASVANALPVTSTINWTGSTAWAANSSYQGPDLSSILQEVVDREGFERGNHALLIIKENNSAAATARYAYALEGDSTKKIKLLVEWSDGPPFTLASASTVTVASVTQSVAVTTSTTMTTEAASLGSSTIPAVAVATNALGVSAATASLTTKISTGLGSSIASVGSLTASLGAQAASLITDFPFDLARAALSLSTANAATMADNTVPVDAVNAVWSAQAATIEAVQIETSAIGMATNPEAGTVAVESTCQVGILDCILIINGAEASTENITTVHVNVVTAAWSVLTSAIEYYCAANLDLTNISLITQASKSLALVEASESSVVFNMSVQPAKASIQSIATPLPASIQFVVGMGICSPHIDIATEYQKIISLAHQYSISVGSTSLCSTANLYINVNNIAVGIGCYDVWRYDSSIAKHDRFESCLASGDIFNSSLAMLFKTRSHLQMLSLHSSPFPEVALFNTDITIEQIKD